MEESPSFFTANRQEIESMEKIRRLNFVNSLSGFKSANMIGTVSSGGHPNLAVVSSVIHLSSSPAVIGFVQRPTVVPRHTYRNIRETGWYTINHVHDGITAEAHYTSAKFGERESEFELAGLTEQYEEGYPAPYVGESRLKMMVQYVEEYHLKASNTLMMVGSIEKVMVDSRAIQSSGAVDLEALSTVCISGLDAYHRTVRVAEYAYARPGQFPVSTLQLP